MCMEYLWDRVCGHQSCKTITWQEVLLRLLPLIPVVIAIIFGSVNHTYTRFNLNPGPTDLEAETDARREALMYKVLESEYPSDFWREFNVGYLLPYPTPTESESSAPSTAGELFPNPVPCQGILPNHVVVSLPKPSRARKWPKVVWSHVKRADDGDGDGEVRLEFNRTEIIPGLWDFSIIPEEAHGVVRVSLFVKDPVEIEIYAEHDFGGHGKSPQKKGMELSKTITKDVSIMRKNVRLLGEKVGIELSAGATATRNVTTELAVYLARDLQVLANTAFSVFLKAMDKRNETAAAVKKEFILVQKELEGVRRDLIKVAGDVQKAVAQRAHSALVTTTRPIKRGLVLSRDRAWELRERITERRRLRRRQADKEKGEERTKGSSVSVSATKELSLRVQNFFQPLTAVEKGKKAGNLMNIARCAAGKEDYASCRRRQKAERDLVGLMKAASGTSNSAEKKVERKVGSAKGCQSKKMMKLPGKKGGKKGGKVEKKEKGGGVSVR